jgi:hypothetical protein
MLSYDPVIKTRLVTLPQPISEVDIETYDKITEKPWLLDSVQTTGYHWGRRLADARMSLLPKFLLGIAVLDKDNTIRLIFARWDKFASSGWEEDFEVKLALPNGETHDFTIPSSSKLADGHSYNTQLHGIERQPQAGRLIPRVLWNISTPAIEKRASHEIRKLIRNVRFMTDFVQCTSLYVVMEDEACLAEIRESGIKDFAEAYNALIPGSYKADLMRYYVLWRYGGVYVDDKCTIRHSLDSDSFDSIMRESPGMFIGIIGWGGGVPEIAFMGARPGCPLMLKALEASIANIMKREYGTDRLAITGSTMLRQIMLDGVAPELRRNLMDQPPVQENEVGVNLIDCWSEKLALLRVERCFEKIYYGKDLVWHRQSIPFNDWPKSSTYYWNLWKMRGVYVDGNPQAPLTARLGNYMDQHGFTTVLLIMIGMGLLSLLGYFLR